MKKFKLWFTFIIIFTFGLSTVNLPQAQSKTNTETYQIAKSKRKKRSSFFQPEKKQIQKSRKSKNKGGFFGSKNKKKNKKNKIINTNVNKKRNNKRYYNSSVFINKSKFNRQFLKVDRGGYVEFTNYDKKPYTIVIKRGGILGKILRGTLKTFIVPAGGSHKERFRKTGTFNFSSKRNPDLKGKVTVKSRN